MTPETRIELAGVGPVACIAMAFRDGAARAGGRPELRVTVMVKAAFALVHDGIATLRGGAPIAPADRHYEGSARRSVEVPGDLAPRKLRADVLVVGSAHTPGGAPASASSARLGVFRDRVLLDKTLHVFGDRTRALPSPQPFSRMPVTWERAQGGPSSGDNPVGVGLDGIAALPNIIDPKDPSRAAGLGPIAATWPLRAGRLSPSDLRALAEPIPELRADFPWGYFQCAPEDQQIDLLHGNEGLLLDGFHPTLPRLQTRLPQVRAKARVHRRRDASWDEGAPLVLTCDTWLIDADHMLARLTFRGDFAAGVEETELSSLRVVAGIEVNGAPVGRSVDPEEPAPMSVVPRSMPRPMSAHDISGGPASVRVASAAGSDEGPPRAATVPAHAVAGLGSKPVVPFEKPLPGAVSVASIPDVSPKKRPLTAGSTLPVDSDLGPRLDKALGAVTPFDKPAVEAPRPPARPRAPIVESPLHGPTATLTAAEKEALMKRAATPWGSQGDKPAGVSAMAIPDGRPKAPSPLAGATLPVDSDLGPRLEAALATPFERPGSRPRAPIVESPLHGPTAAISAAEKEALMKKLATPWGNPNAAPASAQSASLTGLPFAGSAPQAPPFTAPPPVMAPAVMAPAVMAPAVMAPAVMAPPVMAPPVMAPPVMAPPVMAPPVMAPPPVSAAPEPDTAARKVGHGHAQGARPLSPADETGVRAELLSRLAAGASLQGLALAKADLSRMDLSGAALTGVDLRGSNLSHANLSRASLTSANLSGARGEGASFDGAKLERANLSKGRWEAASFAGASMTGADLSGATLTRADLGGADLTEAKLGDARAEEIVLDRCKLGRARADGASLAKASLVDVDAPDVVLDRASMADARFTGAKLSGASLVGASAERASFAGADLSNGKLGRATLDGADLSRASLEGADLRQAKAIGARFEGARMARSQGARADLSESRFASADLTDAVFRPSRLVRADFTGARLDGADLRDADLRGATLTGASRNGTRTTGAKLSDVIE